MQGPCQHHFRSLISRDRRDHSYLGIDLVLQLVHMHVRSFRLDNTCEAKNIQLCILGLKQDLCLCSCPPSVCRQHNSKGQQELGNCHELMMHALGLPPCSLDQVPSRLLCLEEDDCHLATDGLSHMAPVFLACQGLVLGYVQESRWGCRRPGT